MYNMLFHKEKEMDTFWRRDEAVGVGKPSLFFAVLFAEASALETTHVRFNAQYMQYLLQMNINS